MSYDDPSSPVSKYPIPKTWVEMLNQLPTAPEYTDGTITGVGQLLTTQIDDLLTLFDASKTFDGFFTHLSSLSSPPRSYKEFSAELSAWVLGENAFLQPLTENYAESRWSSENDVNQLLLLVSQWLVEFRDTTLHPENDGLDFDDWAIFQEAFITYAKNLLNPFRVTDTTGQETVSELRNLQELLANYDPPVLITLGTIGSPVDVNIIEDVDWVNLFNNYGTSNLGTLYAEGQDILLDLTDHITLTGISKEIKKVKPEEGSVPSSYEWLGGDISKNYILDPITGQLIETGTKTSDEWKTLFNNALSNVVGASPNFTATLDPLSQEIANELKSTPPYSYISDGTFATLPTSYNYLQDEGPWPFDMFSNFSRYPIPSPYDNNVESDVIPYWEAIRPQLPPSPANLQSQVQEGQVYFAMDEAYVNGSDYSTAFDEWKDSDELKNLIWDMIPGATNNAYNDIRDAIHNAINGGSYLDFDVNSFASRLDAETFLRDQISNAVSSLSVDVVQDLSEAIMDSFVNSGLVETTTFSSLNNTGYFFGSSESWRGYPNSAIPTPPSTEIFIDNLIQKINSDSHLAYKGYFNAPDLDTKLTLITPELAQLIGTVLGTNPAPTNQEIEDFLDATVNEEIEVFARKLGKHTVPIMEIKVRDRYVDFLPGDGEAKMDHYAEIADMPYNDVRMLLDADIAQATAFTGTPLNNSSVSSLVQARTQLNDIFPTDAGDITRAKYIFQWAVEDLNELGTYTKEQLIARYKILFNDNINDFTDQPTNGQINVIAKELTEAFFDYYHSNIQFDWPLEVFGNFSKWPFPQTTMDDARVFWDSIRPQETLMGISLGNAIREDYDTTKATMIFQPINPDPSEITNFLGPITPSTELQSILKSFGITEGSPTGQTILGNMKTTLAAHWGNYNTNGFITATEITLLLRDSIINEVPNAATRNGIVDAVIDMLIEEDKLIPLSYAPLKDMDYTVLTQSEWENMLNDAIADTSPLTKEALVALLEIRIKTNPDLPYNNYFGQPLAGKKALLDDKLVYLAEQAPSEGGFINGQVKDLILREISKLAEAMAAHVLPLLDQQMEEFFINSDDTQINLLSEGLAKYVLYGEQSGYYAGISDALTGLKTDREVEIVDTAQDILNKLFENGLMIPSLSYGEMLLEESVDFADELKEAANWSQLNISASVADIPQFRADIKAALIAQEEAFGQEINDTLLAGLDDTTWSWTDLNLYLDDRAEFDVNMLGAIVSTFGLATQMLSTDIPTLDDPTSIVTDAQANDWATIVQGLLDLREEASGVANDYAYVLDNLKDNPVAAFSYFLQTNPGSIDSASFKENLEKFMTITAKFSPGSDFGDLDTDPVPSYYNIFTMIFPNSDAESYKGLLTQFYTDAQKINKYFVPSQQFENWIKHTRDAYMEAHGLNKAIGRSGRDLAIIDRILRLLANMVGVLQRIAAAQAERLSFYSKWQQAYTTLLSDIPIKGLDGNTWTPSVVQEFGGAMGSLQTKVRAWRDQVGDEAKQLQTALNQSTQAANQQASMGTALLSQLSTILSQIYR